MFFNKKDLIENNFEMGKLWEVKVKKIVPNLELRYLVNKYKYSELKLNFIKSFHEY